jgi:Domain of unknown function (DUF4907)
MTTSKKFIIIGVTALLCIAVIFFSRQKSHEGEVLLTAMPIHTPYGWGYTILAGKKKFIEQEYMPAVPGKQGFKSAADALLVGNLVIKKLTSKQWPTITFRDLDSLGLTKN